jgi:hypothetical protein
MTEARNSGITNYGGYQRIEGTTIGGDTRHDATDLTPEQHVEPRQGPPQPGDESMNQRNAAPSQCYPR